MRSIWKGHFLNYKLFLFKDNKLRIISRSSKILRKFVGYKYKIYNGKKYYILEITNNMVGLSFGDFVFTKKRTYQIHSKHKE